MAEEEETEAMETQLSSLELPEHIIHHIFGFLPSIKDVVRATVISKSCLQAWGTFPIRIFELQEFFSTLPSEEEVEAKTEQFIRFVDQRFARQIRDRNGFCEHLELDIFIRGFCEHLELNILIPDSVLSAYWLKSLLLCGSTISIPLADGSHVYLPSLKSLRVEYSDIPDEQLQKLLSGCPALEDIALLQCRSLSKVDIFEHPNLETLEFTVDSSSAELNAISVRAPKLKSLVYSCKNEFDVVVKIHNSPELKRLRITDRMKTDEWFHKFIAKFPLLEDLTIEWCEGLRKIRISNPLLEKINITRCINLEDVVISCKKLASFSLHILTSSILNSASIQMIMDHPPSDCTAHIYDSHLYNPVTEARWYCKLQEFLTRHFMFKSAILSIDVRDADADGDMKGEDVHEKLPPAACNIEELTLDVSAPLSWYFHDLNELLSACHPDVSAPLSWYSHILNGLLSACHPTTIVLHYLSNKHFAKVVCEELGNRGNNSKCWCKDDFKCWKHQLKEVKIQKITRIQVKEDLDWDALFDLLPTLRYGTKIYFKLKW